MMCYTKVYDIWKEAGDKKFGKMGHGSTEMYDTDVYSLFPGKWLTDQVPC